MNTLLRVFLVIIKALFALIFTLFMLPFLISPRYNFPNPEPFHGTKWYNPYNQMDTNKWLKGNFQIQSLAWGGITDGSKNPTDTIISLYSRLGYDIIGISDYQKINTVLQDKPGYIPIYEHGFNMHKTHHVNIGTTKVFWLDFPFYQNKHHKQFIINLLRNKTEIIALAHPNFSLEGYTKDELAYLGNYDLIEALNHQRFSLSHWDAALSAGKPAFILADDDAHDLTNPYLFGVVSTYINAQKNHQTEVINSLKSGNAYGFTPYTPSNETFAKKEERAKNLPLLRFVKISNDTLWVSAQGNLKTFTFIGGDQGKILHNVQNVDTAFYALKTSDHYVRVEIDFGLNQKMYLNPVIIGNGTKPIMTTASVNIFQTIAGIALAWVLYLIVLILVFYRPSQSSKKTSRKSRYNFRSFDYTK